MDNTRNWSVILLGSVLLSLVGGLVIVGTGLSSSPPQETPPLADLTLNVSDVSEVTVEREVVERDEKEAAEAAREMAAYVGLAQDYAEGHASYFLTYSRSEVKSVHQSLYRYASEEDALRRYQQLLKDLPASKLGEAPILHQSEYPLAEGKGTLIEAEDPDPAATAYWFIGVRGKILTVMGSIVSKPSPLEELAPLAMERLP